MAENGTLVTWKWEGLSTTGWVSLVNLPHVGDHVWFTPEEQEDSDFPAGEYHVICKEISQPEQSRYPTFRVELVRRAGSRRR